VIYHIDRFQSDNVYHIDRLQSDNVYHIEFVAKWFFLVLTAKGHKSMEKRLKKSKKKSKEGV